MDTAGLRRRLLALREREQAKPPQPHAERQAEILAWSRRVGWLEE
jgi:hypothetical protein